VGLTEKPPFFRTLLESDGLATNNHEQDDVKNMIFNRFRASILGGFLLVMISIVGVSLTGCSPSDGMVEVSGTVTWNGQPIETGYVSFVPEPSKSPQSGKIENGQFRFRAYPGQNIVRIEAEKQGTFNEGMNQYNYHQFVPPKYNSKSELTEEVKASGSNVFKFALSGE